MVSAPKPSDWGFDVTIAIVAMTDDDQIVTVSDRMISYDDITQAEDNAVLKARRIASAWGILFAAADARMFYPIVDKLLDRLKPIERPSHDQIKEEGAAAYQEVFEIEFASRFLSRHGYKNISEFRKFGLSELGPEVFGRLHQELLKFDLGIQLLCYGYSEKGHPHIIEIENPGRAIDHDLLRYAIIGSGYWMAAASLTVCPDTLGRITKFSKHEPN